MPPFVLILILGAFGVMAFLVWWFRRDAAIKRALRLYPLQRIAEVSEGDMVRVSGRLVYEGEEAPLQAPLSGRGCAAWRVLVQEYENRGRHGRWKTIVDESEASAFLLEDESGVAWVKGALEIATDLDAREGTGLFRGPSPELEEFLLQRGHGTKGWIFNKRIRYREGAFEAGETVTVAGTAHWELDPSQVGQGYRDAGKRLRLEPLVDGQLMARSLPDGRLLATDDPSLARR